MDDLHIIVGLGNPGAEYARTRHNAGFMVVDELARRWQWAWQLERRHNALVARAGAGAGRPVLLCKPQTYMNSSGEAVGTLAGFFRVTPARVLVSVDDADLPLGQLRLRPQGSSGGHHGLESVEQHLGTRSYPRQRVGIGRIGPVREITGHVLGRFAPDEQVLIGQVIGRAADQLECWLSTGLAAAMNKFNGTADGSANERAEQ